MLHVPYKHSTHRRGFPTQAVEWGRSARIDTTRTAENRGTS